MKLHANVDANGVFKFSGSKAWVRSRLAELRPGEWDVEFKPHFKRRSQSQNRYYWSVVVTLVYEGLKDAGFDEIRNHEDAHEVIKSIFFKKVIHSEKHDNIEIVSSTTKFSTKEFSEKMEEITLWAFDYLGVTIPPPNTQAALDL